MICFCNTKGSTERLTKFLQLRGLDAQCIHGDIPQRKREEVMARFRDGELHVFVATDVASRGIDVDDVDAVFNFEVPEENEYYIQTSPPACGWTTSPATPAARSSPPPWRRTAG